MPLYGLARALYKITITTPTMHSTVIYAVICNICLNTMHIKVSYHSVAIIIYMDSKQPQHRPNSSQAKQLTHKDWIYSYHYSKYNHYVHELLCIASIAVFERKKTKNYKSNLLLTTPLKLATRYSLFIPILQVNAISHTVLWKFKKIMLNNAQGKTIVTRGIKHLWKAGK